MTRIKIGIAHLAVLPHLAGNVVTVLKLDEPFTLVIEKEITDTTESHSGQEFHPGVGVVGINEASWVNLNLLEIKIVRTMNITSF